MTLIHKGVAWMEQQSGIDITPCHDADGTWNPSAACRGFSMAPLGTGRLWANGCAEPQLSPPAATCGSPFGGGDGGSPIIPRDAAPGETGPRPDGPAPGQDAVSDSKPPSTTSAGDGATDRSPEIVAPDSGSGGGGDLADVGPHSPPPVADAGNDNRGGAGLGPTAGGCSCRVAAPKGRRDSTAWIALGILAPAILRMRHSNRRM
jgi:hypothetical protein